MEEKTYYYRNYPPFINDNPPKKGKVECSELGTQQIRRKFSRKKINWFFNKLSFATFPTLTQ